MLTKRYFKNSCKEFFFLTYLLSTCFLFSQTNNAPETSIISASTLSNTIVNIPLTAYDKELDPLSYFIVDNPEYGTATISGSTHLVFSPPSNKTGVYTLTFKANDGNLDSNISEITINVFESYKQNFNPELTISGDFNFGESIDLNENGEIMILGTPDWNRGGSVKVYKKIGTNWTQLGNTITGDSTFRNFGVSVSINAKGNIIAVGSNRGSSGSNGSVFTYKYNTTTNNWDPLPRINGPSLNSGFGFRVGLNSNGKILVVSAPDEPTSNPIFKDGIVKIFSFNGTTWSQLGNDIKGGTNSGDRLGLSLATNSNGMRVAVGSMYKGGTKGSVKIFDFDGTDWSQVGNEINGASLEYLGDALALSSNGGILVTRSSYKKKVKVYKLSGNSWTQIGDDLDADTHNWADPSTSIDINNIGDIIVIGEDGFDLDANTPPNNTNTKLIGAGRVGIYKFDGINWNLLGNHIIHDKSYELFGYSVKLSSDAKRLIVGSTAKFLKTFTLIDQDLELNITASSEKLIQSTTTTITFTVSKDVSTFTDSDVNLTGGGNLSSLSAVSSSTYTAIFTPPTNYTGTVTLTVNAGSIEDEDGNLNTQTSTLALSVDTIAPSITTLSHTHQDFVVRDANTVPIFVTFTEPMSSSPKISIDSLISNASMTVSPSTNSQTWSYDWDVPAGNDGVSTATISATDLFGNSYAGSENLVFTIDNISPTISLTENNDNDILLKSESSQFTLSSNETVAGTPTMTIETTSGTTQANFTASGASWTYTFTAPDSYTGVVSFTAGLTDIAGNISTATKTFSVDTEVPELTQISSPNTNGKYTDNDANPVQSDTLSITVSFNEDVYVTGTPSLALNTTPVQSVFYSEGSGTQTLTFSYKVQEGVEAADLTVTDISVGSGASILDAAGNPSDIGLTDINTNSRNLSDLKDLEIRAKDPVLSAFTAATNNSSSNRAATDTDVITYNFSSNVPLLSSSVSMTLSGFSSQPSLTQTNTGNDYTLSFTVASGMPEGPVQFRLFATDTHSSTQVPQENPSANYTQAAFDQVITIDRTPPTISSTALSSPENSLTGPSVTANEPISNYAIIGGADQALLNINATTGQLSFVSAPDFEAPTDSGANNVYEIEVEVTDLVGLTASQTIAVTVTDVSDTFGVELVATDAQSSEEGGTAIVAVRLFTQPTAEVQINLQSSDPSEGSLSNSSLLFTTTNWNVVQNVTITGVDDTAVDGDITYQLQVASVVSADSNYNNLAVSGINLVNVDNEIDTDGDGYFDYQDAFPTDPSEWTDTDADGIGDNADPDDDNDGFTDITENECGNDPLNASDFPIDSDADGVIDCQDVDDDNDGIPDSQDNCPFVSNALQADADLDGLGDLCDLDDDNDGTIDVEDAFPLHPNEWLDTDGDGIGNNADEDDDNDGQSDVHENNCFSDPLDAASMALDTDADRIPDCVDPDDDNDGVLDTEDVFPLDPNEWTDTDANGIGNNADPDDDNDGFTDLDELECNSDPLDSGEKPSDIDGDGIADCLDPDKDGDNVLDIEDSFPTDPSEWSDADNDGLGDNFDIDDDNDGCLDPQDAFPLDPSECADADADGIGDNADPDDNNDGFDDEKVLASGVLTPNSSGMESTWKIVNIEQYPNARVRVYNVNAMEVFNVTNYKNDWQGTFKGSSQMLPAGSYYYVIDLNIGQKPMTGWLYITY